MRSVHEQNDSLDSNSERELSALLEIELNPEITQRQLSSKIGIALGLTNVLIKNLAQKGLIKASQAGWKRSIYNLTPQGITHKVLLTQKYITRIITNYQIITNTISDDPTLSNLHLESKVAIIGTEDFAELIYLALKKNGIDEIESFSFNPKNNQKFLGMPVTKINETSFSQFDKVFIATLGSSDASAYSSNFNIENDKLITFTLDGKPQVNKND